MEISERILGLLKEKGFSLNEIQKLSIPLIANGENCLVIAPTGFGKTEAAILPILNKLMDGGEGIKALYITPLRALNRDLLERIKWWCGKLEITVAVRHGDTPQFERQRQSRHPPQFLLTTPETLQSILSAKRIGNSLKNVEFVVVDEVHELYNDKRGAQLSIGLERLFEKKERKEFQRIGLSATIGNPQNVAKFLFGSRNFKIAQIQTSREISLKVESPRPNETDRELSNTLFLDSEAVARLRFLNELIEEHKATLAFVNTRQVAETLTSRLITLRKVQNKAEGIGIHHGSLSKEIRKSTEQKFRDKHIKGLLATSSLELGIDIGAIDLVVQYMSPRQVTRLIQRVGRSGHSKERIPKGVIIASTFDDICEAMAIVKMAKENRLESFEMEKNALDVVAHQLAGMVLDYGSIEVEKAKEIINRAYPFKSLNKGEIENVAKQLHSEGNLWFYEGVIKKNSRTLLYYYYNLSTIPSERKFFVKNIINNSNMSTLDENFVANYLELNSVFITKGVPWSVVDITEKEVLVEPSQDISAAIPDWVGEEIPVSFEVAQKVGELRRKIAGESDLKNIEREYDASQDAVEKAREIIEEQSRILVPDESNILVEICNDLVVIHVCGGSLANEALSHCLSAYITSYVGESVRVSVDPYRIIIQLPTNNLKLAKKLLAEIKVDEVDALINRSIIKSNLFRYKFIHVAKAFGLIDRNANYKEVNMRRIIEKLVNSPIYFETLREIKASYLDVERSKLILSKIASGEIKLHYIIVNQISPFAREGLSTLRGSELIAPIEPTAKILSAFKSQITEKNAKLFCTYCNKITYQKISEIGKINCPYCGSSLVAFIEKDDMEVEKIFKKRKQVRGLSESEKKHFLEIMRRASLMEAYGKKAAIALSVYGVGPETAARILQKLHREESPFLVDLLEAQKQFIRTKRFWAA
jgi:ATP-dependent Lhr-like helicase